MRKDKYVNQLNDLYLGNQKSYSAENGIKLCEGQYNPVLQSMTHLALSFKNINKTF